MVLGLLEGQDLVNLRGEKGLLCISNEGNDDGSRGHETQSQGEAGRVQTLTFKSLVPFQIFFTFFPYVSKDADTPSCHSWFPKSVLFTMFLGPGVPRATNLEDKILFVKSIA